jgi:hypothetical protein
MFGAVLCSTTGKQKEGCCEVKPTNEIVRLKRFKATDPLPSKIQTDCFLHINATNGLGL